MALDVSRIPPIGSRGFDYFRANILPSERAELDAYVASLQNPVTKQPIKQPAREEVVDLNADPFEDSFPTEENFPTTLKEIQNLLELPEDEKKTAYEEAYANLPDNVREVIDNTQLPPGVRENLVLLGGQQEINYGEAGKYDSPEEALANYAKEYGEIKDAVASNTVIYNMQNAYRNPERAASGLQAFNPAAGGAAQERLTNYLKQNNIPLSKEINGKTYYLTLGTGMQGAGTNLLKEETGKKDPEGQWVVGGAPGTYSTQYIPPLSNMEKALSNPIAGIAAAFFPGGSAVLAGLKAVSGMSLSPTDVLTLIGAGLDMSGVFEGVPAAEAQAAADAAVESAIASGTVTTAAQAAALENSILAATSIAPEMFGVPLSDITGMATGRTTFADVMSTATKNSFPELAAAMEASQKAGVPEGMIVNWSEQAVEAAKTSGTLDAAIDAFNVLRGGYLTVEEKKAAEAETQRIEKEAAAEAERQRIANEEAATAAEEARVAAQEAADKAAKEAADAEAAAQAEQDAAAALEQERLAKEAAAEAARQQALANEAEAARVAAEQAEADRLAEEARVRQEAETVITDETGAITDVTGQLPGMPETPVEEYPVPPSDEEFVVDPIDVTIGGGGGGDGAGGDAGAGDTGGGVKEEDVLLKQVYQAVLEGELSIEDYIKMGGQFIDELRSGTPYEDVYGPVTEEAAPPLDSKEATATGEDEEQDLLDWERVFTEESVDETFTGAGDGTGTVGTVGAEGGVGTVGTEGGVSTESGVGIEGTEGGVGTVGTEGDTGDSVGAGTGAGTGAGAGEGAGTGTGVNRGTTGATGLSATRTTDSMFGDMFQMKTKAEDTQRLLDYIALQAPQAQTTQPARTDILNRFLQQQALGNERQGMLTNAQPQKRFPY